MLIQSLLKHTNKSASEHEGLAALGPALQHWDGERSPEAPFYVSPIPAPS